MPSLLRSRQDRGRPKYNPQISADFRRLCTAKCYVGATADGTIYRGDVRQPNRGLSIFLAGGGDGRATAIGMKVDARGYLWVAGGPTGNIWLYDTRDGRLLSQFNNGITDTFINDVTITPDGAAYFTDSRTPIIYRVALNAQGIFTFEYWRDLRGTPIQYVPGFNLNGIVNTADGAYLIVVKSDTGQLFRITTATKEVSEIALAGGDQLLVVNSQFNRRGQGAQPPTLPFTVSGVPMPSVR